MERVTIGKLKNQLSAYLRKVKAGETVIVCDRNTPIARIMSIETEKSPETSEDRVARMVSEGKLIPPKHPMAHEKLMDILRQEPPASRTGKSLLDALLEERAEGR